MTLLLSMSVGNGYTHDLYLPLHPCVELEYDSPGTICGDGNEECFVHT